jgi:hypothetical protein
VEVEEDDGSGLVIVPLAFYQPETHVGVGGLLVDFFRLGGASKESRVSSIALVALVTTRKQVIVELLPDLYWDDEGNHLSLKLEYQYYPDRFWGIGPRTPEAAEERYTRERFRLRVDPRRRVAGRLYVGPSADLMSLAGRYPDSTGTFAMEDVPGEEGGVTLGLGPAVSIDSRDNTVNSRTGTYLSATWLGFHEALGSRYRFWKLITEARQFFPVGKKSAFGVRYYGEVQNGLVPYYHLAMLGGDEMLRGYFLGRYRDATLVAVEGEYRFPLFWKFGAVAFAGAGEVAPRLRDLASVPVRVAAGSGLRLALNTKERLNLRLDVAAGPGAFEEPFLGRDFGVYFTAREAF